MAELIRCLLKDHAEIESYAQSRNREQAVGHARNEGK